MRRLVVVAMLLAPVVAAWAARARPARRTSAAACRPASRCPAPGSRSRRRGGGASTVVWEMRCPLRGYIVAGIDARVSDRAIDVTHPRRERRTRLAGRDDRARGGLHRRLHRRRSRATSFQPFIGCIPTSGGGARGETAVRHPAAYAPVRALDRRVVRKRLVVRRIRAGRGRCPAGTRLLGASHAFAFRTEAEPGATLLRAVSVRRTGAGRTVDGRSHGSLRRCRRASSSSSSSMRSARGGRDELRGPRAPPEPPRRPGRRRRLLAPPAPPSAVRGALHEPRGARRRRQRRRAWRRHVPAALVLASLAALCVAFARPTVTVKAPNERASVVLVVDTSGSMRATDVKPTRLAAAKRAMRSFLERAPASLRVGVVSFSDEAQVVVSADGRPCAADQGIDVLGPGFGTAIGDAARACRRARPHGHRRDGGRRGHRAAGGQGREGPRARLDPPALRRRPDPRPA